MKVLTYGTIGLVVVVVALFLYEQIKKKPVQPDASGVEYNTATWDNSFFATSEAQAYGSFQPQAPAVPNTPYGWETLQAQSDGGVVPITSGMPKYAT